MQIIEPYVFYDKAPFPGLTYIMSTSNSHYSVVGLNLARPSDVGNLRAEIRKNAMQYSQKVFHQVTRAKAGFHVYSFVSGFEKLLFA